LVNDDLSQSCVALFEAKRLIVRQTIVTCIKNASGSCDWRFLFVYSYCFKD